jgi:hypothetical protein
MGHHIRLLALAEYVMEGGTLDVPALEHLDSCPDCREDVLWLRRLEALRQSEAAQAALKDAA